MPEIKIMDERNSKVKDQIIYEWGSTIELRCVVSNLVGEQPEYIIWKKDDRMLNYDLERGGIRSVFTLFENQSKFPRYNMKCRGKHDTS